MVIVGLLLAAIVVWWLFVSGTFARITDKVKLVMGTAGPRAVKV